MPCVLCFYCTSTKPNRARKVPRAESQVDRRAIIPAALQAPTTPSRFRLGDDRKGIFACRGLLGTARGPTTTRKASTSWCWFVHLTVTNAGRCMGWVLEIRRQDRGFDVRPARAMLGTDSPGKSTGGDVIRAGEAATARISGQPTCHLLGPCPARRRRGRCPVMLCPELAS